MSMCRTDRIGSAQSRLIRIHGRCSVKHAYPNIQGERRDDGQHTPVYSATVYMTIDGGTPTYRVLSFTKLRSEVSRPSIRLCSISERPRTDRWICIPAFGLYTLLGRRSLINFQRWKSERSPRSLLVVANMGASQRKHNTMLCYTSMAHIRRQYSRAIRQSQSLRSQSPNPMRPRSNPRIDFGPLNHSPRRRQARESYVYHCQSPRVS